MPTVAEIHLREANVGGWLVVIEGIAEMFTNIPDIVGTGASSWIGTAYGAREVKLGLVMPGSLPFGETDPWLGDIRCPQTVAFTLVDLDGGSLLDNTVVKLFSDQPDPSTTYTLFQRLSPLDDPAPNPGVGLDGEIITLWDRHVGLERIGPAGERRYFWLAPDDAPPGLDHPASTGWPASRVSVTPATWTNRKIAVYRIVQDPDTGLWPSWQDQYDGGSLWWFGSMTDNGRWSDNAGDERTKGRAFTFNAQGPVSWTERSLNLARPSKWYKPEAAVSLTGDELKVAVWIEPIDPLKFGDGIGFQRTVFDSFTLNSGHDLTGLTSATEIWTQIGDIVNAAVDGANHGTVVGADNATWTGPVLLSDGVWNDGIGDNVKRQVIVSTDGQTIQIKCEAGALDEDGFERGGYRVCIAADVRVWQLAGWDTNSFLFNTKFIELPVGGTNWGEAANAEALPEYHVVGLFSTRDEQNYDPVNQSTWDNNGFFKVYKAPYQNGCITLDDQGGTEIYVAVGDVPCEGQHGYPFPKDSQIDGSDVDSTGWWVFRGMILTAAEYNDGKRDGVEKFGVALCEWVSTDDGTQVVQNNVGYATLRILRWEDPAAFNLPGLPFEEPWVNVLGVLECAPLGVFAGGAIDQGPGWRHRMIPSMLVSSGTSVWDTSGDTVVITPGVNHPGDLTEMWPGDREVADLGLGLPAVYVDWRSWETACASLPGGLGGPMNRVMYPVSGSVKASAILREAMAGAGLGWICARDVGGKAPRFGAYDPLKPLNPLDAVVTLTRELMAEPTISDTEPQWRGKIELRRGGPYDRFIVEAGRNPLGNGDPFVWTCESHDPDRRARSGRIEWKAVDGGIRDPLPWRGYAKKQLYDWTNQARERFAGGFGARLAAQLRIYRADYRAEVVPLLGLGSVVRVTDSTAEASDGTRGIDHMGRVCQFEILSRGDGNCTARVAVELERYPVSAVHVWGPYAYSGRGGWNAGTGILTISQNSALMADFSVDDTVGWQRPAWCTATDGQLRALIVQSEDGETALAGLVTADVVTSVLGSNELELDNITGTLYRDTVKLIVAAPLDDAGQVAEWAQQIFAPVTTPGGTWDGGTLGTRLK
jgi:hypothetical protein